MQTNARFLGITVLGDYLLSEGIDQVLENLNRVGATAVACNPTVTAPAPEGEGTFQPPDDADSSPRLFDRPLFGKRALWVRSGPSYQPAAEFYKDSSYGPRQPNDLTDQHGAIIGQFIDRAVDAGLRVYFQVGAVQPSGLRDEDRPRLPNGQIPEKRLADTGSLASPAIREYNRAYVRDLLTAYPRITGFRIDWPEYPCYTLGEALEDFSPHVEQWARENWGPLDEVRDAAEQLHQHLLGGLTNDDLEQTCASCDGSSTVGWLIQHSERLADWLTLKTLLSEDILKSWRSAIDDAGGADYELSANAFMPRYTDVTGFSFGTAAKHVDSICPKLYTMHWSLMVEFWGRVLLEHNDGLDERLLVRTLEKLMDIADDAAGRTLADYGYPKPDEPHPIANAPQQRKINEVLSAVSGRTPVYPLVHGYGPDDDFRRRLQLVADLPVDGVWINRYGYLGDPKLRAIAQVWGNVSA